jgi:ParB-like chromosome segregation protein Spo0J
VNILEKLLSDLKPYENNPRNNAEAVQYVANSIQEFGFKVPIVIDKEGVIVAGHTRYKAAQQLGLDKVPCIVADDLTPEQVKAFRLADNKTAEIATWDFELLELEVSELGAYDMTLYGFEEAENESGELEEVEREDLSDKVGETFEIIIECADEDEQEATYNKLVEDGYKCRVLTL